MKEIVLLLVVLAYAIPFGVMFFVDFVEVFKRMNEMYNQKLKPAVITTVNHVIK